MSDETKQMRLGKVSREFNLGVNTIVEFLASKGIEVESSPNAKIDHDSYVLIRSNFQQEKEAKEKAQSSTRAMSERESVTLASARKKAQEEDEIQIDLSAVQRPEAAPAKPAAAAAKPAKAAEKEEKVVKPAAEKATKPAKPAEKVAEPAEPQAAEPVAEPVVQAVVEPPVAEVTPTPEVPAAPAAEVRAKEEGVPAPVAERETAPEAAAAPAATPAVAPEAPAEVQAPTSATSGVKVVGKVDLASVSGKKKAKGAAGIDPALQNPTTTVKPVILPPPTPTPEPAAPVVEKDAPREVEFVETKFEKLSGPTVLGKIELPVEKKRTPGMGAEEAKRKRKRITKVDVERTAARTNTPGAAPGSRPGGDRPGGAGANRGPATRRPEPRREVSPADIQKEIKDTLARLSGGGSKSKASKLRKAKRSAVQERHEREMARQQEAESVLKLTEFVTVAELASMMQVSVNEVISACMTLGIMVSINQRLDSETISIIV